MKLSTKEGFNAGVSAELKHFRKKAGASGTFSVYCATEKTVYESTLTDNDTWAGFLAPSGGAKDLLDVPHPQEDKSGSKPENQHAGQNS